MPKITDTQSIILSRAATRPGNLAMPLPDGLAGAAAKTVIGKMIEHGWLEEVDAKLRQSEPIWRETGDGHGTTLVATKAGLDAIGIEAMAPTPAPEAAPAAAEARATRIRPGTKQAEIIALIQRPEGASIAEIVEATGWLSHSARGLISGGLKKKLNLPITADKVAGRGTVYKLESA